MSSLRLACHCIRSVTSFRNKSSIANISVKDAVSIKPLNRSLALKGWVQAVRKHKGVIFVDLTDGSSLDRLQVVINAENNRNPPTYGSSINVQGILRQSAYKGQDVELFCDSWNTIGFCAQDYPFLARQSHSADYMRQLQHLRPKTKTFKSILRVRNAATVAVHNFFQDHDFVFVHTPIITLNDCEGGGEVFYVEPRNGNTSEGTAAGSLKNNEGNPAEPTKIEFFKYPAFLTVSGQFHLEAVTGALPKVYNFGPTFRAEKNQTSCHLSEFSMIEAEVAFLSSLEDLTKLVECLLKSVVTHVMDTCSKEIDQIFQKYNQNHRDYLNRIVSTSFLSMSYAEALELLEKNKESLKVDAKWGEDLGSEHKKFIIKHCNDIPVFVTEFPASIKPFYMKPGKDGKGLCFDLFAPFGQEICSGSLREENFESLKICLQDLGLIENLENDEGEEHSDSEVINPLSWYLDLRKYGSVPHGGFGVGFDRLLQTILGIPNIRDVVPFPRWSNHCKC